MRHFTTNDMQEIKPITYDWGAVKWASNNEVAPGSEQSFGLVHMLPGKTNSKKHDNEHTVRRPWVIHLLYGVAILLCTSVAHA